MNLLDLFSGIGGFHLGLEKVGHSIKWSGFCEIDKYASAVYRRRFPNAKELGDIKHVRGRDLPKIDIITFGSPCQDFSIAGKRKGMSGSRSSLIAEAIRLIDECRPSFFIWENVKGTFSSNNGADFWGILQAFTDLGSYRLEWQLLNTRWVLPQNRERIFLVGHTGGGSGREIFPIGEDGELYKKRNTRTKSKTQYAGAITTGEGSRAVEIKVKSVAHRTRTYANQPAKIEERDDNVSNALNSAMKDSMVKITNYGPKNLNETLQQLDTGNTQRESNFVKVEGLKQVGNVDKRGHNYRWGRVYDPDGISTTINSEGGGMGAKTGLYKVETLERKQDSYDFNSRVYSDKGISKTLAGDGGNNDNKTGLYKTKSSIRRLTPKECERLQGFPDDWTSEGIIDGEIVKISDTQRYKQCGNAVTVDIVALVAEKLL